MSENQNNHLASDRRFVLKSLVSGAGAVVLGLDSPPALADCIHGNARFRGPSNTWKIFQNANPPADNTAATALQYNYWPCTDAYSWDQGSTNQAPLNTSTWNGRIWVYVWANRAISSYDPLPNPIQTPPPMIGDIECRVQYSTVQLANAATQCLIRHWLGMTSWAEPWTSIPGNSVHDFVKYSELVAHPTDYFGTRVNANGTVYRVMTDRPWLLSLPDGTDFNRKSMGSGKISHTPGVVLDYETGDLRDTATSLAFFQAIYGDISKKKAKLFIYTDALDRVGVSGLDATNLPQIAQNYCDYLTVMLWGSNPGGNVAQTYNSQIAVLTGPNQDQTIPWGKLVLLYDLNGTTLNDAQFAYNTLTGPAGSSPQAVCFWRNTATQGGACLANKNANGVPVNKMTIAVLQGSAAAGKAVPPTSAS